MKLYTYYRSSSAYRVRIALNLKGLDYQSEPVHLARDGGEQKKPDYLARNPQGLVPLLEIGALRIPQSMAIIEYLEETHPEPALLPTDPLERARVRGLAHTIAMDIQPLNNLRVLKYLTGDMALAEEQKNQWYRHWIAAGFTAVEKALEDSPHTGQFCHGDQPGLADCMLVPQVYNAERFKCPMDAYPLIQQINQRCLQLPAFHDATPEQQADAE